MRVIAGIFRSRKLKTLEGLDTRPTADRIREALFNILGVRIEQAMVLDLFAGSGALGLEAVSRGARFAVLNDISPRCVEVVQDNVEALRVQEETGVMCLDAFSAIRELAGAQMSFDVIFVDPPYDSGLYAPIITAVRDSGILALNGMIVCEHRKGSTFEVPYDYRIYDRRVYGKTTLSFVIEEIVS